MRKFTCGMCGAVITESQRETHIQWEAKRLSDRWELALQRGIMKHIEKDEMAVKLAVIAILVLEGIFKRGRS